MMHHKASSGPYEDMMFKDSDLTDAQKQQIREIERPVTRMNVRRWKQRCAMHDTASDTEQKLKRGSQNEEQRKPIWRTWKLQNKILQHPDAGTKAI